MTRLLVCIDLSERTAELVERAAWFAERLRAEVWLLHVAAPDPAFVGYETGPASVRSQVARQLQNEDALTEQHARPFRQMGLNVTTLVVQGATVERIFEHAERLNAELILIGSRGHSVVYELMIGSVAHELLKRSTRPVLVVPPSDAS